MKNFNLSIQFTPGDTQKINSGGLMVSIIKGVQTSSGVHQPLWAALAPFEKNTVIWKSSYGVYASTDRIKPGAVISALSTQYPAKPGVIYPFANNVFDTPKDSVQPGEYAVENNVSQLLTFGLLQGATGNGKKFGANPVNAIAIYLQQTAMFQPTETISVFLHKQTKLGAIIKVIESPILVVEMASNPAQTIHYDGSEFVLGPLD